MQIYYSHKSLLSEPSIGPGAYDVYDGGDIGAGFKVDRVRGAAAPFGSMQEKLPDSAMINPTKVPGPGHYDASKAKNITQKVPMVSGEAEFKSKSNRMCSTAPGSTAFSTSSIVDNPGPGEYGNNILQKLPVDIRTLPRRNEHNSANINANYKNVPSVPNHYEQRAETLKERMDFLEMKSKNEDRDGKKPRTADPRFASGINKMLSRSGPE